MCAEENKSSLFDLEALKELGGVKAGDFLAVDPELEPKFMSHIGRTVKHDVTTTNLVLKTGLSAYTKEPLNVFLRGGSGVGKTYVVVNSLARFPKEDVWYLGGLSPTALVHDRGQLVDKNGEPITVVSKPEKDSTEEEKEAYEAYKEKMKGSYYLVDLQGKVLVFLEAPNIETFNKLRPVLSHDVLEISYKFTDTRGKGLSTTHVVLRGWPATVFCSTSEAFVQDLATRSFTFTPETTEDKYKDANVLTGSKAAFPWKFERDSDAVLLEGYITYFKDRMKEVQVIVPYGEKFGELFPAKFPRSMRDCKHVLGLVEVSALFHLAQRPALVRTVEGQKTIYVMATKQDYDRTVDLWEKVREATETSAASHVLKFFHDVVETLAKTNRTFTVKDLTDAWNANFPTEPKSSDTIRKYVDFLCDIGYMTKERDDTDRRQNLLYVIKQESGEYTQNELSVFFKPEMFKEWLNAAKTITASNHVSLREKFFTDAEATPDVVYDQYFSDKNPTDAVNGLRPTETPKTESTEKKTDNQESVQFPKVIRQSIEDLASKTLKLERLTGEMGVFEDKCISCGFRGRMDWQVTEHDGSWALLCAECGLKLSERLSQA